jgi:ribonuclease D
MKVTLIADKTHPALLEILRCATTEKVIAVDLEGDLRSNGTMSLMQVAFGPGNKAYILDLYTCPELLTGQLAKVLESTSIVKVFHDCRNDARALKGQFGVSLKNVFDTQAAHFILSNLDKKQAQVGLNLVLATYAGKQNTHKAEVVHRSGLWEQRPLPNQLLDYAAQDVLNLVAVYHNMKRMVGGNKDVLAKIEEKSMQMATPPQATAFCNSVLPGSAIERTPANNRKEQHKRAKELLKDTCKAFLGHLQANTANVNVETLPQTFDDWK